MTNQSENKKCGFLGKFNALVSGGMSEGDAMDIVLGKIPSNVNYIKARNEAKFSVLNFG